MPSKKKSESEKQVQKPIVPWVRVQSVPGSVDRDVDVDHVENLLADRWEAKLRKSFEEADKIAASLQGMHIAYHDDKKTWYTKAIPVTSQVLSSVDKSKKLTKKQERNKRQAEKNRRKKTLGNSSVNDDSDEGHNSDSESEIDIKPTKKKSRKD